MYRSNASTLDSPLAAAAELECWQLASADQGVDLGAAGCQFVGRLVEGEEPGGAGVGSSR